MERRRCAPYAQPMTNLGTYTARNAAINARFATERAADNRRGAKLVVLWSAIVFTFAMCAVMAVRMDENFRQQMIERRV